MDAVISECGKYRYVLRRSLGSVLRWYKPMLFVMLNPSTADATEDDPTIRRCMDFARREGMTHLNVVNLFAFRSPDPKELRYADDPVGPENDRYLREEIGKHSHGAVVAAWGAHHFAMTRGSEVYEMAPDKFWCLGRTKGGYPKHPLYLPKNAPLEQFSWRDWPKDTTAQQATKSEDK